MNWTKELPKKNGIYWWNGGPYRKKAEIVEVWKSSFSSLGFVVARPGTSEVLKTASLGGWWFGPLREPKDNVD